MIGSFRDKGTERLWQRHYVRHFAADLHRAAWRKIAMLDAAECLEDLLNLQARYDLEMVKDRLGERLTGDVKVLAVG